MAMWVVVALATWPWRDVLLYRADWTWGGAILMFACGLYIYSQSGKNFSAKQFGGLPEVHGRSREQRLATDGIRSRVRPPADSPHFAEPMPWRAQTRLARCFVPSAILLPNPTATL